jgi:hypothetical protein
MEGSALASLVEAGLAGRCSREERDTLARELQEQFGVAGLDRAEARDLALALSLCLATRRQPGGAGFFDALDTPAAMEPLPRTPAVLGASPRSPDGPDGALEAQCDVALALLGRLDGALAACSRLSARYTSAVARLGGLGPNATPLDAHHLLFRERESPLSAELERRIRAARDERLFWQEMLGHAALTPGGPCAAPSGPLAELEEALSAREHLLQGLRATWAQARSQLNEETYAKLMAQRYKKQARAVSGAFFAAIAPSPVPAERADPRTRALAALEELIAPVLRHRGAELVRPLQRRSPAEAHDHKNAGI